MKKEMRYGQKIISTIIFLSLCLTCIHTQYNLVLIPLIKSEGISSAWFNNSSLSVQVIHYEPRINWYGFQYNDSGVWRNRLNQKIEVDNNSEYRFIINISSDQGWADIEFINLTAWYDNGTESSFYNQTHGGNLNLYVQYENTSSTSNLSEFRYLWPGNRNEVTFNTAREQVVNDSLYGFPGLTEARNMTFPFKPNKQFRYAPGNRTIWNTSVSLVENSSRYGLYNNHSWNFNITIDDSQGYRTWVADEFGVYRYSEIISAQNPSILGYPGSNSSVSDTGGSGNISIITCSNGNFNLSVNITALVHVSQPSVTITRSNVYVRGGDRSAFKSLLTSSYLYGGGQNGMDDHRQASVNGTYVNTTDVEYKCNIPIGQLAGEYSSNIYYHLSTQEE